MGIVTGLLFYFKTEDTYEKNIFNTLAISVSQTINIHNDDKSKLLASLHLVNNALGFRQKTFGNSNLKGFKASILQPLTVDLMTAQGACGSYALVMARLMEDVGFEARMVQMKADGIYGEHNIVEVKIDGNWAVVDPLYDLYFKKPDGNLASFIEVQNNWNYYKAQVPDGYNRSYKYEDARYTNWDKIPIILPSIKKLLDWRLGSEKADGLSLRIFMMRKFNVFFICGLLLQCILFVYTLILIRKKNIKHKAPFNKSHESGDTINIIKNVSVDSIFPVHS